MAASGSKTLPTIGFLAMVENSDWGVVGGLLVLNAAGRPLEFHCTAPFKPNRAQEILYGPTLRPFLFGEQIGPTLVSKAKSEPLFYCTDCEAVMSVRESTSQPVVLIGVSAEEPTSLAAEFGKQRVLRLDAAHSQQRPAFARLAEFTLGKHAAAVLEQHCMERDVVLERWKPYAEHLDLVEPFGRIREALQEAQRGVPK